MKRQLQQMAIFSAGLLCVTQALAGWTDVTEPEQIRALQASSAFHGHDVYGRRFVGHFDADNAGAIFVDGSRMTTLWHFNGSAQLCIEWQEGTECYRVQKSDGPQSTYRAVRVRDGQETPILVRQARPEALSALSR
jgi:hypothetical protein